MIEKGSLHGATRTNFQGEAAKALLRLKRDRAAGVFEARPVRTRPNTKLGLIGEMTLGQACPSEYQGAQCAFKDSMIH